MTEHREKDAPSTSFEAQIVLRPRSLDETLDLALVYLRRSPRPFLGLALILVSFASALIGAAVVLFQLTWSQGLALAVVLSPLLEGVVTVYAGKHLFKNNPRIGHAIRAVSKRLPFALASALLVTLPVTILLWGNLDDSIAIALGVLLGSFWPLILATQAYIGEVTHLEHLNVGRAMRRSQALITFRYGRALGLLIVTAIIRVAIAGGVMMLTHFTLGFLLQFGDVADAVGAWPALPGYLLAGPYIAVVRLFDYVDCRTRREGWDIQVRFNAIAQKERQAEARSLAA